MTFHCDECGKEVGEYLYGAEDDKKAICNNAHIGPLRQVGLPDTVCFDCIKGHAKVFV